MKQTSFEAFESIQGKIPTLKEDILSFIRFNDGATCDEIEENLKLPHQTVSARIRELAQEEEIVDSGETQKTRSGRNAIIWK